MIELLVVLVAAFVLIPILLVGGVVFGVLALALVAFKAVLWVVLLPVRVVFWVVAVPILLLFKSLIVLLTSAVLLPLMAMAAILTGVFAFLFIFLPALPLFFVAAVVWLIVRATKPRPAMV